MLISMDPELKSARVSLCQQRTLEILKALEENPSLDVGQELYGFPSYLTYIFSSKARVLISPSPIFQPEYARYMIEAVPGVPYTEDIESFLKVETDMKFR